MMVWWINLGWVPDTHPATFSLTLLNRAGEGNKMKKLMGQDKDGEITCQLLPQVKRT